MSPNLTGLPQRYLRTPEAARFVGLSIEESCHTSGLFPTCPTVVPGFSLVRHLQRRPRVV
jgi:hypothetical protein